MVPQGMLTSPLYLSAADLSLKPSPLTIRPISPALSLVTPSETLFASAPKSSPLTAFSLASVSVFFINSSVFWLM